jgi:hypothetical protein
MQYTDGSYRNQGPATVEPVPPVPGRESSEREPEGYPGVNDIFGIFEKIVHHHR